MERFYGAHLCYGPPIEGGYYYDAWMADKQVPVIINLTSHR